MLAWRKFFISMVLAGNLPDAQLALGFLYEQGKGVGRDCRQCHELLYGGSEARTFDKHDLSRLMTLRQKLKPKTAQFPRSPKPPADPEMRKIIGSAFADGLEQGQVYYRLPEATVSAVLLFTAMSMNARAARLRALSLRKTRARSRRICASAMSTAARTFALTSS